MSPFFMIKSLVSKSCLTNFPHICRITFADTFKKYFSPETHSTKILFSSTVLNEGCSAHIFGIVETDL